jgi:hypothetical protein
MGAYRCAICAINYRFSYDGKCPACSHTLSWMHDVEPTVDELAAAEKEEGGEVPNLLVPNVDQPVTTYNGLDWISHEDLVAVGYTNLEPFQVVRIRHRFYELQSRVGLTRTTSIAGGAWWIEEVNPRFEVDQLFEEIEFFSVLSEEEYHDLECKRGAEPL